MHTFTIPMKRWDTVCVASLFIRVVSYIFFCRFLNETLLCRYWAKSRVKNAGRPVSTILGGKKIVFAQ